MSYSFNYTGERAAVRRAVENDALIPATMKKLIAETLHEKVADAYKEYNGVMVSGTGHENKDDGSYIGSVQSFFVNPIKLILTLLLLVALGCLAAPAARAQTNNSPLPSPQTFFQTAEGYLTAFNPDFTWSSNVLEVAVGADYQSGLQWANDLEIQYDVGGGNWGLGYRMRNAGIAGVVEMNEAKLEYSVKSYYDTRVEISLSAGYDNEYACAIIEPELDLRKKLTENTFAGIYISEPIFVTRNTGSGRQWVPNAGVETGFTF